jgi:hypothetical protein
VFNLAWPAQLTVVPNFCRALELTDSAKFDSVTIISTKKLNTCPQIVQAICLVVNHIFAVSLMIRPRFELNMTPTETEPVNIK